MASSETSGKLAVAGGSAVCERVCVCACVCVEGWQGVEAQMERVTGRKEPQG